jgi:hypothetical protein
LTIKKIALLFQKGAKIEKLWIFGKNIEFLFFTQFWCSFFVWIDCAESLRKDVDRFTLAYGFEDKQKEANKSWIPKFDLFYFSSNFKCRFFAKWSYGLLMDHNKLLLFYFEKESKSFPITKILHAWKAYLTFEVGKCPKYSWSIKLLFWAYDYIQHIIVPSYLLHEGNYCVHTFFLSILLLLQSYSCIIN